MREYQGGYLYYGTRGKGKTAIDFKFHKWNGKKNCHYCGLERELHVNGHFEILKYKVNGEWTRERPSCVSKTMKMIKDMKI